MYTKETLVKRNGIFAAEHFLNDKDVTLANIYKLAIEASRSNFAPKAGDILIMKDGTRRHIDKVENKYLKDGKLTIVEGAYTPFTSLSILDETITVKLNTSGGPWSSIQAENVEFTGEQKEKAFGFFGSCGMRANGQLQIDAMVNVWRETGKEDEAK